MPMLLNPSGTKVGPPRRSPVVGEIWALWDPQGLVHEAYLGDTNAWIDLSEYSSLPIDDHPELYAVLGQTFGAQDCWREGWFDLPRLIGHAVVE